MQLFLSCNRTVARHLNFGLSHYGQTQVIILSARLLYPTTTNYCKMVQCLISARYLLKCIQGEKRPHLELCIRLACPLVYLVKSAAVMMHFSQLKAWLVIQTISLGNKIIEQKEEVYYFIFKNIYLRAKNTNRLCHEQRSDNRLHCTDDSSTLSTNCLD